MNWTELATISSFIIILIGISKLKILITEQHFSLQIACSTLGFVDFSVNLRHQESDLYMWASCLSFIQNQSSRCMQMLTLRVRFRPVVLHLI
jgi:hypothetical protein